MDISGSDAWVDCLLQCEESPLALALKASPIKPDVAPLFNSSGCTASSSSSGSQSIVYAAKPHDDPIANTTCAAVDAPAETCVAAMHLSARKQMLIRLQIERNGCCGARLVHLPTQGFRPIEAATRRLRPKTRKQKQGPV